MRLTVFWKRMSAKFGASYADSVARDHVFSELGSRTIHEAIAGGVATDRIWRAVCEEFRIPATER